MMATEMPAALPIVAHAGDFITGERLCCGARGRAHNHRRQDGIEEHGVQHKGGDQHHGNPNRPGIDETQWDRNDSTSEERKLNRECHATCPNGPSVQTPRGEDQGNTDGRQENPQNHPQPRWNATGGTASEEYEHSKQEWHPR